MQLMKFALILNLLGPSLYAGETFTPYRHAGEVPQNMTDLWKDYDAREEPLDVQVVKEWTLSNLWSSRRTTRRSPLAARST
jgi:hypothetical protein